MMRERDVVVIVVVLYLRLVSHFDPVQKMLVVMQYTVTMNKVSFFADDFCRYFAKLVELREREKLLICFERKIEFYVFNLCL